MRACVLLRHTPNYRSDVFANGLRLHGYKIEARHQRNPGPNDILVIWNRTRSNEATAAHYEANGARVIVAENGYLDRTPTGGKFYALALGGHNGSGRWFVGDRPRFEVEDRPWRESGDSILVLPQRGIGQIGVKMPSTWINGVQDRLRAITDRPLIIRPHPGHQRVEKPLEFENVWACVTWGSGAGIKALRAGVPVFHELECWIGAPGAALLAGSVERCHTPDRRDLWTRLTWAQWTLEEIGSGEAFDRLLNEEDRRLLCPGQPSFAADRACHVGRDRADRGLGSAPLVAHA